MRSFNCSPPGSSDHGIPANTGVLLCLFLHSFLFHIRDGICNSWTAGRLPPATWEDPQLLYKSLKNRVRYFFHASSIKLCQYLIFHKQRIPSFKLEEYILPGLLSIFTSNPSSSCSNFKTTKLLVREKFHLNLFFTFPLIVFQKYGHIVTLSSRTGSEVHLKIYKV